MENNPPNDGRDYHKALKDEKNQKAFNEKDFWKSVKRLAAKAGKNSVYSALLLFYTLKSEEVPMDKKAIIVGALGYLILPIDFIPDFIPVLGFSDDLAALTTALLTVRAHVTPAVRHQARQQLSTWFGPVEEHELSFVDEKLQA